MSSFEEITRIVMDDIDEGLIYVNSERKFQLLNRKAKEILGITIDESKSHPRGHIQENDIVIIADNLLGYDDGSFTCKDLERINIYDNTIKQDSMFIGIGVFENKKISPVYKFCPNNKMTNSLSLDVRYMEFDIHISISEKDKSLSITIDDINYSLRFMRSSGHLVIIDGQTREVKFFQAKGYSIRKETLKDILSGKEFSGKGYGVDNLDLVGQSLDAAIESGNFRETIENVLCEKEGPVYYKTFYMNKIPTQCSILPIQLNDMMDGVLIKISDISEWETFLKDRNKFIDDMEKVYRELHANNQNMHELGFQTIIGNSPEIQRIKYLGHKASQSASNVIITGESGTGKSQLAYEIHKMYKPDAPFIEVNCSAIPQTLFESELFGYVGGAFTGALSSGKAGYFEMANGGTIFLDEIGEIPMEMQAKLLQVLQTKRFYRIGSSRPVNANVKVIAATNRNLLEEVWKGNFRQDLYYRLNVFPITIPPLRERRSDIYLLINKILRDVCMEFNMPLKQLSDSALNKLINYDWPGNVRELENIIEQACALSESDIIFPEYIFIDTQETSVTLKETLLAAEKRAIEEALQNSSGDKLAAMKALGISKASLYNKIQKHGIVI